MSQAIYCERCKKLFKKSETTEVDLDLGFTEHLIGDLCNNCKSELETFYYGGDL